MPEPAANLRMLVVDDETVIADSLAAIFRLRGYDALAVYSGEAAVAEALSHPPAILLSDISMMRMDGVETAILVSRACPDCRILLFSGYPEMGGLLEKARNNGHEFEVMAKPVHPDAIFAWLRGIGIP